jgi:hypothetical protein
MKNLFNVLLVRLFGIIALVAVIGFSFACSDGNNGTGGTGGGGGNTTQQIPTFTTISDFATWLKAQPNNNTNPNPYKVKLILDDLGGPRITNGSVGSTLYDNPNKYISIDFSGSTFTSFTYKYTITYAAFDQCGSLVGITIPDSVTNIGQGAFIQCSSLTSITIPKNITSIGGEAFSQCSRLTSVTFATGSNIANADFGNGAFPEGDIGNGGNTLKTAYSSGKAGTYTRANFGDTWKKK